MKKYKSIVVLGKFMPPHKGHEYMIRFAKQYGDNVHVIVDCLKEQTIEPPLRKKWLEEQINGINVIALTQNTPQQPEDHPDFWNVWKTTIINAVIRSGGEKPDLLVAAMDYGWKLSEVLECDFVPIDVARETFPISATQIREDIFKNWDFLMESARPFFMKKLCFMGPESTGKTTCSQRIAKQLNTIYVPEYAKSVIEKQNGQFFLENVEQVALAQINSENALSRFVNKVMICDSDPLTTLLWSELLFNTSPIALKEMVDKQHYDMTFLFYPDTIFVEDLHRNLSNNNKEKIDNERLLFFEKSKDYLEKLKRPYMIIKGGYEEKYEQINNWIENNYYVNNQARKNHDKI